MTDLEFERVSRQLKAIDGRRQMAAALLWLPRGLLIGLLVAALVAALARFRPILDNREVAVIAGTAVVVSLLLTLAVLLLQRRNLAQQARFADNRLGLYERASTAVEIESGRLKTTPLLASLQLADTAGVLQSVEIRKSLPLRPNWQDLAVAALAIILLAMAAMLPNSQVDILEQRRAIDKSIAEQVQALEALEQDILSDPELSEAQQIELLEPVQGALEELAANDLSQEQAVATLSEAEADLRELSASNDTGALRSALEEAARPLGELPAGESLGRALESGELAGASAQAFQLADRLPGLSSDSLSDLAQALSETAAALEEVDPELSAELAEAAEALRDGDIEAAQDALRRAGSTLQERFQEQAAARQAAAAAGQLAESRAAVAQADQPGQLAQPDQGQDAGQAQSGQGQGQSAQGGPASGEASGLGSGAALDQGEGLGGPGPGGGHAENVYVPDTVDLSGAPGEGVELPAECLANPDDCGALISETDSQFGDEQSLIPYNQVFGDYRDAAYQAMDDNYVPLGLKAYVRDYFSSLEP
jgi:hypothetical protein